MCWGNRGKVIIQSWNLLSGFTSLSLKGYHHLGRSHPPSRTLGERERLRSSISCPKQFFLPTRVHAIFLAAKKQQVTNCQNTTGGTTLPAARLDAHLTDRHSADAGVQESCGRVGTHFTHKGEFLFPADTVFLNFLSMRMKKK